jgi:LmbE family N-acetylglucosaminyl deacetylase
MNNKIILCVSPHSDDCEISCGGTIAKLSKKNKVFILSFAHISGKIDSLDEQLEAAGILGVKALMIDYPIRYFSENRQDILDDLIEVEKSIKPDLVFIPSNFDTHQDHQVISQEAFRVFKYTSLWGYEVPHNNLTFKTNGFVSLKESDLNKKISSVKAYGSQEKRNYTSEEFIKSQAIFRGEQIGVRYAETFEIIRSIL